MTTPAPEPAAPTTDAPQTFQAPPPAAPGQPNPIPRGIAWDQPITAPTTTEATA